MQSSAGNKYTFVWKKAVDKNEKKLDEKLKEFLRYVEEITRKENHIYGDKNFAETGDDTPVTSEEIKTVADQINKKLAEINDLDDEDFLENVQKRLGCKFKFVIADAGYGNEENYDYLEKNEITGIVRYTTYEKETKRSFKKKTFNTENWKYDAEQKEYTCPCGNPVPYKKTVTKKNKSGYLQTYEVYQCENCEGCPFRELCKKSEYGRVIQRNGHWL